MNALKLMIALAAIGVAVPASAQSTMSNTQATANTSMTNGSMHKTTVVRHTTSTTHPTRHATMHKKSMMSCRRMTHAQMRRTARCRSMMGHHATKMTVHTEVKKTN